MVKILENKGKSVDSCHVIHISNKYSLPAMDFFQNHMLKIDTAYKHSLLLDMNKNIKALTCCSTQHCVTLQQGKIGHCHIFGMAELL